MKHPLLRSLKRLFDPWSVPHFLFGMVMALGGIAFGFSLYALLLLTIILAIVWEYIERRFRIHEARGNPWMDVLLPVLAFGITLLLVDRAPLHNEQHFALFVWVLVLYGSINVAAWKARFDKDGEFLG